MLPIKMEKINTLTFNEMKKLGIYLVASTFGFTMKYLQMTLYRFLRGNLAPGQETSVRDMLLEDHSPAEVSNTPPTRFWRGTPWPADVLTRWCPSLWISRHLSWSSPMTLSFSHLPRMWRCFHFMDMLVYTGNYTPSKKHYHKEQRTRTCANKEQDRKVLKNRTAGWQFVIDPHTRHVVAAMGHIVMSLQRTSLWQGQGDHECYEDWEGTARPLDPWWCVPFWTTDRVPQGQPQMFQKINWRKQRQSGWGRFEPTCLRCSTLGCRGKISHWTPWIHWAIVFG